MKKQLLFSILALFGAIQYSAYSQVGNTCDNPIVIGAMPFQTSGNTVDFSDSFDISQGSLCGATPSTVNYFAGNDVFYSYTANESVLLNLTMTPVNATNTNSGIFVYDGCENVGVACVTGLANPTSNARTISFSAIAGHTYIIAISSSSSTPWTSYSLAIQKEGCQPKPSDLSVTDITTISANLQWSDLIGSGSFEVAVQPVGSLIPQLPGVPVSTNQYFPTNLFPATQYQFWVRQECWVGSGTFTSWAGPYLFNTQICESANKCVHIFRMTDSANNGWNGARMQVRQNGIVVATMGSTYNSGGGPVDLAVALCNDVPFDVYWSVAGTQPQQCNLDILNSFGQDIYSKPAGTGTLGSVVYSNIVNCTTPVCNFPVSNISLTDVSTTAMTISWNAPATNLWDVYIVPSGSPAPTQLTPPTYNDIDSNPFTTTVPLAVDTSYDVYVRNSCGNDAPWSTPAVFTTLQSCFKPTILGVGNVTSNSATLTWTKGTPTDNSWEVLLIPSVTAPIGTPNIADGMLVSTTIGSPLAVTNLTNATIYYYYVRTVCGPGEVSNWTGPYVFNTQTCADADKCTYKFVMTDAGGNGWEGGRMQVRQNGIVVATIGSVNFGSGPSTVNVALCNNVPFDLYWSVAGSAPAEMGVSIQSPFTETIYEKPAGAGSPLTSVYSDMGNCTPPTCQKPSDLIVNVLATTQTSAEVSWTETGSAASWEVYVVPVGGAAPVNGAPLSGVAPYYIATSLPYTISGLTPGTLYSFYVRAICSSTDISTWNLLSPKKFMTRPVNDECTTAIVLPFNPTNSAVQYVSSGTFGATPSSPNTNPACSGVTDDDVWFSFTATASVQVIRIFNLTGASTYLPHVLYTGNCENLAQLYCALSNTSIATNLVIGQTYFVRVYTFGTSDLINLSYSNFDIAVTTPPAIANDECATATAITPSLTLNCTSPITGSLLGATASGNPSTCDGVEDDDVWFSFVATSSNHIIDIENIIGTSTAINQSLYLANGCDLTLVNCSSSLQNAVPTLIIGQTYKIRVWSTLSTIQDITFDICVLTPVPPLSVITSLTPQQLVTDVLLNNPCITVSNITSSTGINFGSVNGLGAFTSAPAPLSSGIVLSTGSVANIPGSNTTVLSDGINAWTGDTELETVINNATNFGMVSLNATKLEFDFSTANAYMSFNFMFASEEYGAFQCSFSDAFAFLLTDLITNVTTNLAVIPGTTTPVSVITIRDAFYNLDCASQNVNYFDNFYGEGGESIYATGMNFGGQTKLMTASSEIIPNHPYHIKLVVADRQDTQFDTAVFIQAGSFSSGPPQCMDKIQLAAYVDANANGSRDENEPDFTYGNFTYQINDTGDINNISSPLGLYTIYDENPANAYDFSFNVNPEYSGYFAATATAYNNVTIPTGSGTQTLYFPVTLTQGYNDVTVSIVPVSSPVPGSAYTNKIVYKNLGIAAASGTLSFTAAPSATITSVSQSSTLSSGGFAYDFTNLMPYETRYELVTMSLPSIPTVNIGDLITNSATITAPSNDINTSNNVFSNTQTAVAAYDPNNKMEAHGPKIGMNQFNQNDYLYYTINFQNTGTAHAGNVKLEDLLDAQLDETSIRMVSASHNYIMERINNKVIWRFDYIQLPGIAESEELSKGYVTFMIKLKPGFAAGNIIPNSAAIYFDSNPAITTNVFETEFVTTLGNTDFTAGNLVVYPNPATSIVQISLLNTSENIEAITLYDMLGKAIKSIKSLDTKQAAVNISGLSKGIYMIEITTGNKFREVRKLVIQ